MRKTVPYLFFVLILACVAGYANAEDIDYSWFKPVLTENNDPACERLLQDAQNKFLSDSPFEEAYGVRGHGYSQTGTILDWEIIGGASPNVVTAFGNTYYLHYLRHPGCGGACGTVQPLVSDKPFPEPLDYGYLQKLAENAPPAVGYDYTIARASNDAVYLLTVGNAIAFEDQILIYRLAREGHWTPACKISTAPAVPPENVNKKFIKSLESLAQVVNGGMIRGAGDCGSMKTYWRWRERVQHALQTVLYRPWAFREKKPGAEVDGSFNNDIKHLEQWSLLGISEYAAFQQFQKQLHATTEQLAAFLHKANGWSFDTAKTMASDAIKGAVSTGIRFYAYDPRLAQGEEAIRRAILEKRDIRTVHGITFDAENIDASAGGWDWSPGSRETILNIAIEYPEALRFLLEKGVNPNHVNAFGKTPLMYAAQYNQLASAKLLIKHGANVNAVTIKPENYCYYTLSIFNMTPLHYAVRYASPELIQLLVDSGAEPLVKAENHRRYPLVKETPLDWLHRYTGVDAKERNPNISDAQAAEIAEWLTPLTPEQAIEKAADYVQKAETDYQKGNVVQAYRYAALARQLQPKNQRALADLSLIALKNGKLGKSLEASQQLIGGDADDKMRANAWFNKGLACEQYRGKTNHEYLYFNGAGYCTYGVLYPYLKSYQTDPTTSRMNKLKALFADRLVPYCEVHNDSGSLKINFQMGADPKQRSYRQLQTFYVLHSPTQTVTGEDLAWDVKFHTRSKSSSYEIKRVVPEKVTTLNLDDKVLSVFKTSTTYVQFPYQVFGTTCTRKESM